MASLGMTNSLAPIRPRNVDGWGPGAALALVAHGLLVAALVFSVNWRTSVNEVIEAEMWSDIPIAAQSSPPAEAVPPRPSEVTPPPPVERPPTPAAVVEPPPAPIADISLKRELPKPLLKPPPKPLKKAEKKPEKKPEPKEEWILDPPPKQKQRAEPPAPAKTAPPHSKAAATPVPSGSRERDRQENIKRMLADLGGSTLSSSGPSAEYAGRIKGRIKPNIVFTDAIAGNPVATVEVRCAADGRIIGRRLLTPSGVNAWDDAVLRAIDRTEVLPLNEQGKVPPVIQIDFRPRDF